MEPLVILIVVFIITLLTTKAIKKVWLYSFAGCVAMSVMLLFTGVSHFLYPEGMALMLPDFIPFKKEVIYLTGVIEITAAIGILIPRYRKLTAWLLIIFFLAILPANIHAAINHVNLRTATFDGSGLLMVQGTTADLFYCLGLLFWNKKTLTLIMRVTQHSFHFTT